MNLSDSDSDVDEEFMKHLFSDDMLKELELEDRRKENELGTRDEEPSTSHGYMEPKRGKRKMSETARSRQKNPRNILSRKERDSLRLEEPEEPLPSKFRIGDVVLDFNLEESSEPMHVISDVSPVPPPNASRKEGMGRHTKYKVKEWAKSSKMPKSPVDIEPPPEVENQSDQNFRHITPVKMNIVDEFHVDLPSSEDIWKMYKDLKEGLVPPSEAEWPLCCMVSQNRPKTPPKVVECLTPVEAPSQIVESQEKNPAEGLTIWDMDAKLNNATQQHCNFHDEDFAFDRMTIGVEENRALKDWIQSEGLNEPHSDIEEFDMLLSLARDHEKNRDILFELLKPKNVPTAQVKPPFEVVHPKIDAVEPQEEPVAEGEEDIPVIDVEEPFEEVSLNELRPERPIILEVKVIVPAPAKHQDEAASSSSSEKMERILTLPPLPDRLDQCLQKIRILRRPRTKRNVEGLRLRIEMNHCNMFCTLQMNKNVHLQVAVKSLDNAVYNSARDVIEVRYEATQIGWIWSNGTVMIINGGSNAMLSETHRDIVAKIVGKVNFQAEHSHNLLHLRLSSVAYFPWRVSLPEFSGTCALSSEPFLSDIQFVYYVDKELPGVSARLHESGMVQVFAMNTAEADKMLTKLYLLTANHRKAEIKVIKNEPN